MKRNLTIAIIGMTIVCGSVLHGSAKPLQNKLEFDAASIRPAANLTIAQLEDAKRSARLYGVATSPGGLTLTNISLRECIGWAYRVNSANQLLGGPGWIGSDRYDIVARSAGPASNDQLRLMLQSLLADRFSLAFHKDSREFSAQVLLVGKNGPRLTPSQAGGAAAVLFAGTGVVARHASMTDLANFLGTITQSLIVDMTALTGSYDFMLNLASFSQNGKSDSGSNVSLTDSLIEALPNIGLRMESRKVPLDVLIVDRAEKASAN